MEFVLASVAVANSGSKLYTLSSKLYIKSELNAFLLHEGDATIDDSLIQFKVRDTVAQQSACSFVLLEHGDGVAHVVQVVGSSQSGRTGTNHSHLLTVALNIGAGLDEALLECHLCDGGLVLAVGGWLVVEAVEHAGLLAEGGTDAAGKFGEGVGGVQQAVGQFPVAFIQRIVPFGRLVAQRTGPVAEGHATVHAARGLQLAFARGERLLHLAKIVDSIVNRTVTRLLAVYL